MNIKIQTVHFTADKKLLEYLETKLTKLEKFFDHIVKVEVFLKLDNQKSNIKDKVVEIRVNIPGNDLFAKENHKTFEESIDFVIASIQKQLKKIKEKLKDERKRKSQK